MAHNRGPRNALLILLGAWSTALCASTAAADDVRDWAGLYVGGQAGFISGQFLDPVSFPPFSAGSQTFGSVSVPLDTGKVHTTTGGVQAGYGWLFGTLIVGIEGHASRARLSGSVTLPGSAPAPFVAGDLFRAATDWNFSVRGRAGVASKRWLLYGSAGPAFAKATVSDVFPSFGSLFPSTAGSANRLLTGATAGGGLELALTSVVTIGVEYRYVRYRHQAFNLGQVTVFAPPAVLQPATANASFVANEVTARLNVRLHRR